MTKRVYPFEGNLLPQMKVHVGQKQINNGVSRNERMKDVYDKTLNLLKTGAKTLSYKLNASAQMDSVHLPLLKQPTPSKLKSTSNQKQMLLTDKLQLKVGNKIINNVQMDLCGCCRLIDRSTISKCYYCDQILCSSCLSSCTGCSEMFCQNCSLPVYNNEEEIMCLNCYQRVAKEKKIVF